MPTAGPDSIIYYLKLNFVRSGASGRRPLQNKQPPAKNIFFPRVVMLDIQGN